MKALQTFLIGMTFAACGSAREAPSVQVARLELERVDGLGTFSFAEQKGKVLLVDHWATWCGPCIPELGLLQGLSESYSTDDVVVVGIVHESGAADNVREFLQEKGITYLNVMGNLEAFQAFGPIRGYPTKFLIDKSGLVVKDIVGPIESLEPVKNELERLLAHNAPQP